MKEVKKEVKKKIKKEPKIEYNMKLVENLDNIFILGRGQSLGKCPVKKPENSEFWGCNNVYKVRELDRLFIIRDVYMTKDIRKTEILKDVNEKGFPVYTLGAYPEIKNNVRYPVEEVIKEFKTSYILNTAAYMIALAIMQKPKRIALIGVDMAYATNNEYLRNKKACVEFWLGMALGRNIKFILTPESTLLKRQGLSNYYGLIETVKEFNTRLDPKYSWGRPDGKSAIRYKIIPHMHTL